MLNLGKFDPKTKKVSLSSRVGAFTEEAFKKAVNKMHSEISSVANIWHKQIYDMLSTKYAYNKAKTSLGGVDFPMLRKGTLRNSLKREVSKVSYTTNFRANFTVSGQVGPAYRDSGENAPFDYAFYLNSFNSSTKNYRTYSFGLLRNQIKGVLK